MCKFEGEPSSSCMKNNAYIPSHRFSGIYIHRCVWKLGTIWVPKNANICQKKTEGRSNIGGQFLGLGDVFFSENPKEVSSKRFFRKAWLVQLSIHGTIGRKTWRKIPKWCSKNKKPRLFLRNLELTNSQELPFWHSGQWCELWKRPTFSSSEK